MSKVIIIGSGPAGISAALYTKRSGIDTTVISMGEGSLSKAHLIENYYGLDRSLSGSDLHKRGIEQAKALDINFIEDEVVGITFENKLTVTCPFNSYEADAVIIATGQKRNSPKIKGLSDFEGTGVSYCATCDGFFHRGKDTVVFGNGLFAQHEAEYLANMCNSVTILTNGEEISFSADTLPEKVTVNTTKISELIGEGLISAVVLEDGSQLPISGFFVATGTAGSTDLARKIGAMTDENKIKVDENMATNVPGLYAAGDCTGGMLQIAKAVYEGAVAGSTAAKYVKTK